MTDPTEDPKLPVAAAAREVGLPERSLFRAVEKGRIPSTKRDGVTVVSLAEVRAWAAAREAAREALPSPPVTPAAAVQALPNAAAMPGSLPSAHGSVAGVSGRGSPAPTLDGDLASTLFAAFEGGETPVDLVQRLRLSPQLVLAAHGQFTQLKTAGTPSLAQARLDQVQTTLEVLMAEVNSLMTTVGQLTYDHSTLAAKLAATPVPPRGEFRCGCGVNGWVASHVRCTACGKDAVWGFHPPQR